MPGVTTATENTTESATTKAVRATPASPAKIAEGEILQRMVGTFQAVRFRRQDNPWLAQRLGKVIEEARLFMRYPSIPLWPPRMLVRRLMRAVLAPMFEAQIDFNEAVRDVLIEFRKRDEAQTAAHEEALKTIATLEMEIDSLKVRLDEAERDRTVATPIYPQTNGNGSHVSRA